VDKICTRAVEFVVQGHVYDDDKDSCQLKNLNPEVCYEAHEPSDYFRHFAALLSVSFQMRRASLDACRWRSCAERSSRFLQPADEHARKRSRLEVSSLSISLRKRRCACMTKSRSFSSFRMMPAVRFICAASSCVDTDDGWLFKVLGPSSSTSVSSALLEASRTTHSSRAATAVASSRHCSVTGIIKMPHPPPAPTRPAGPGLRRAKPFLFGRPPRGPRRASLDSLSESLSLSL